MALPVNMSQSLMSLGLIPGGNSKGSGDLGAANTLPLVPVSNGILGSLYMPKVKG